MDNPHELRVKVQGDDIIVTMEATGFRVVYRKPHREPWLVAKGNYFPDEQKGPITRAEFLAQAWKAANEKARKLGWIV
jgi:hypothetical protein